MKKIVLFLIRFYQIAISPFIGPVCRFNPTCSEYAFIAIQQHGLIKGIFLAVKRILRCHPYNPGGFDPVPKKNII
ncbi:MAG: membrane protein insertion efficiency factor YidD [Proteobacteria bacterium]|nr:membrane protein insertion efficiency factor YidD [Pseudomonadota bacterium]MBU4010856.1 membrane protein insertion efficiency factor YidD [Pseudomonadota bacterium]